jgi:hypothetical protein
MKSRVAAVGMDYTLLGRDSIRLLDVRVDSICSDELLAAIEKHVAERQKVIIANVNIRAPRV